MFQRRQSEAKTQLSTGDSEIETTRKARGTTSVCVKRKKGGGCGENGCLLGTMYTSCETHGERRNSAPKRRKGIRELELVERREVKSVKL